jgi:hypothetical protein
VLRALVTAPPEDPTEDTETEVHTQ